MKNQLEPHQLCGLTVTGIHKSLDAFYIVTDEGFCAVTVDTQNAKTLDFDPIVETHQGLLRGMDAYRMHELGIIDAAELANIQSWEEKTRRFTEDVEARDRQELARLLKIYGNPVT